MAVVGKMCGELELPIANVHTEASEAIADAMGDKVSTECTSALEHEWAHAQ